ncbi:hypothetical protein DFH08DRAFT_968611 [Mycena albidolilacea]|uniref:Uncharacterized protein n=1 Tax=Mycena albidolilacea TaxID=1033008 RepID=A0AAD6ZJQ5_9AGAR|nr:hypothetical protein DFH08DRAFT_968611 [Mycena albidolilacea]
MAPVPATFRRANSNSGRGAYPYPSSAAPARSLHDGDQSQYQWRSGWELPLAQQHVEPSKLCGAVGGLALWRVDNTSAHAYTSAAYNPTSTSHSTSSSALVHSTPAPGPMPLQLPYAYDSVYE